MMAVRLLELHRVLKPTGILYLHCDPAASHYLKILMDSIFGAEFFKNEIVWQRTNVHNDSKTWSRVSDTILFYSKNNAFTWNKPLAPHSEEHIAAKYWYPRTKAGTLDLSKRPRLIRFLEEMPGTAMGNIWTDISPINSQAQERLGYPTQKPLALLERIIPASSNEGDTVLDPFCGCGTAVHAAQELRRKWIGIDVTHLAISLIERRLRDAFPGIVFEVHGTPKDLDGARSLAAFDKYQFQWRAVSLVEAIPYGGKKKGADSGIDGTVYFKPDGKATEKALVSVKGADNVGVPMVRDRGHVIDREKAKIGVFITLAEPTKPMRTEAVKAGFFQTLYGKYPKIQILTIAELFAGKKPNIPLVDPSVFNRPAVELARKQERLF